MHRLPAALALASLLTGSSSGAGEIRYRESSAEWGLAFTHHHGGTGDFYMPETMGSGVAIFDFDGDGDADVLFIDSGALPTEPGKTSGSRLFRNDGGQFIDATHASGFAPTDYGMGVVIADYDNDGDADVYVTAFGGNSLWRNRGDGSFEEVTAAARVGDARWSAAAAFGDGDGDGLLDLYVANYVDFAVDRNIICGDERRRLRSYCHPDAYGGVADAYFRNQGDGSFVESSAAAGLEVETGRGLGVLFDDLTGDGRPDIYVANDSSPNFLFRNLGDGNFEETGLLLGVAFGESGRPEAGMGLAHGDLDGDGLPEIAVTHLDLETNAIYSATPGGIFLDRRFTSRLAEHSLYRVGFGIAFGDLDLDGDLDVAVANGHIIHNAEQWGRGSSFEQPNQIFTNNGSGRFALAADAGLDVVLSSRGLATGDLDRDGDLDLVINNSNAPAEIYQNVTKTRGKFLAVRLAATGGQRIGTRLELLSGDKRQTRTVTTGSSYLSQHQETVHFGLAPGSQQERSPRALDLRWPGGRRQRYLSPRPNSMVVWPAP